MAFYDTAADVAFRAAGSIYHLSTKPLETAVFYKDRQEMILVKNIIAICLMKSGCRMLAYSQMSNHFHVLLEGTMSQILAFFYELKLMLANYYRKHGRPGLVDGLEPGITQIEDVRQFRNALAYVIRNSFVVNPNVNVFADPCSCGHLYFNPFLKKEGIPANELTVRQIKQLTSSRPVADLPASLYIKDGEVQDWSFVDYERAMSFYENARQFVFSVLKNVEAHVETAIKYGETPQLADEELTQVVWGYCKKQLKVEKPGILDKIGRQKLAIMLKNDYYASNGQIARVAGIPLTEVNALFPLVAKAQIR